MISVTIGIRHDRGTPTVPLLTVAEMDKARGEDVSYRPPGG
jgi:hypothetical protein